VKPTREHYSGLQKFLHWGVALAIVWQFTSTFLIDLQPEGSAAQNALKASHGLSGITILLFMLTRLVIRLRKGAPALPTDMGSLATVAKSTHFLLYALIFVQVVTGIMAGGSGVKAAAGVHGFVSFTLLLLITLHVAAAIWHISKGDEVGRRMFRRRTP
jgi:cytochrome b561